MTAKIINVLVSEKHVCPIYNARKIAFSQHKIDLKRLFYWHTSELKEIFQGRKHYYLFWLPWDNYLMRYKESQRLCSSKKADVIALWWMCWPWQILAKQTTVELIVLYEWLTEVEKWEMTNFMQKLKFFDLYVQKRTSRLRIQDLIVRSISRWQCGWISKGLDWFTIWKRTTRL